MNKKLIITIIVVVLVLLILAVSTYFYLVYLEKSKGFDIFGDIGDANKKILDDATRGTLPSLSTNPLENKPDINPADAGNPIKDIKTNPFE